MIGSVFQVFHEDVPDHVDIILGKSEQLARRVLNVRSSRLWLVDKPLLVNVCNSGQATQITQRDLLGAGA